MGTAIAIGSRYAATPSPHYVNALILAAQRRLGTSDLLAQARAATATLSAAVSGAAPPTDWPRLTGYAALAQAATADGDAAAGALAVQALRSAIVDTGLTGLRPWADDMFLAALLVDATAPLLPAVERARAIDALNTTLLDLAGQLQQPDGLFDHAVGSPVAWGRGNGFAALALTQALALRPSPALLAALQRHLRRLLALQAPGGAWRQVLNVPGAPFELTATAMIIAALARARRHGWVPAAEVDGAIARAWQAVQLRVSGGERFADACSGTPAGPTLAFYLQRPITHGRDERAAAMVLTAALEMA